MSDGTANLPDQNGAPTPAQQNNGLVSPLPQPNVGVVVQNGAMTVEQQLTNGAVTRNKRMCRRKTAFKDDYTTKTANQIKSLRLKNTNVSRPTRIPKLPPKPCKAGTNVVVKAKVLQEVPEGLLVMSIQWRGKEYCGCFIDSSKQGWALPRFDDPKVSSIAFLTKKAQLLASDIDDSTDDEYSPKTKRKRAAKGKKTKKRKVKNGDTSNGKAIKTPTKAKNSRSSEKRRQSTDNQIDKPDTSSDKTNPEKTPSEKLTSEEKTLEKISSPEKNVDSSEKAVKQDKLPLAIKADQKAVPAPSVEEVLRSHKPVVPSTPDKPFEQQSVIVKTESAVTPRCVQSSVPMDLPLIPSPNSVITTVPKQIRAEKTATIPVGTLSNSLLQKQSSIPRTVNSPFSTITSPAPPINGALVSPLHNHTFPLMVPPPFFIPNFLQSAKFLADGAKRTQASDSSSTASVSGSDFSSVFGRNTVAASTAADVMLDSQLRNSMT